MSLRCTSSAVSLRGSRTGRWGVAVRLESPTSVLFLPGYNRPRNSTVGTLACSVTALRGRGFRAEVGRRTRTVVVGAIGDPGQSTFLSLEEAGLIDMTGLDMHEKFLARLTVSSLNLLRAISEQEGIPIEDLNAGRVCDWFVKDKEKRAKNVDEATLKWDAQGW